MNEDQLQIYHDAKPHRDDLRAVIDSLQDQLAAEQFHSAQLRGAMLRTANYCRIWGGSERARKVLEHYLALPHNPPALDARLKEERKDAEQLKIIRQLVAQQATDEGLWFMATTLPEAYLQRELRKLAELIEEQP